MPLLSTHPTHPQILQNTPPTLTCQYLGGDMLIVGRDTFLNMLEGSSTQQSAGWDGICDSSQEGIWYHYSHHYYLAILFQQNMYAEDMHMQKFIWLSKWN